MSEPRPTSPPLSVLVEPDPARVTKEAIDFFHVRHADQRAVQTRGQLGLTATKPIVMTGHQATWWHPGILAKYIACQQIASRLDAAPANAVPDQDEADFDEIPIPVRTADGALARRSIVIADNSDSANAESDDAGFSASARSAFAPTIAAPADAALRSVSAGVASLTEALGRHQNEPSAARQVSRALDDLRPPGAPPAPTVFASELHRTDAFGDLVHSLGADADAATKTYNNAVARFPEARIAPLFRAPARSRYELPLWRLAPGEPRRAVYNDELDAIPLEQIAPKALLFTGFLRLYACDLFIHGTGGGVYDRITETWLEHWLSEQLAPKLVVSATLTLPLDADLPTASDVRAAVWRARHAQHHPAALGLTDLQKERDALHAAIVRAKAQGANPAAAFGALHAWLDAYRTAHQAQLADLGDHADRLEARQAEREIASDRTWAFFLHEPAAIESLTAAVGQRVAAAPKATGATNTTGATGFSGTIQA